MYGKAGGKGSMGLRERVKAGMLASISVAGHAENQVNQELNIIADCHNIKSDELQVQVEL